MPLLQGILNSMKQIQDSDIDETCSVVFDNGVSICDGRDSLAGGYSFLITCFNLENFISESIHSAFEQKWESACECVIVDDASTDASLDAILDAVKDAPVGWAVRVYRHNKNLGVAKSYEHGIFLATQPWIIALDGDDIALPGRVFHINEVLRSCPGAVLVADSVGSFGTRRDNPFPLLAIPSISGQKYILGTSQERSDALAGRRAWKGTYCGAFAFRRGSFLRFGPVMSGNDECRPTQDKIIMTRAFLSGPVIATAEMVLLYRSHTSNLFHRLGRFEAKTAREQNAVEQRNYSMSGQLASSIKQCLQDVREAMKIPMLSDFSQVQLLEVEKKLQNDLVFQSLFSRYCSAPIFVRPFLLLANWRKLSPKQIKAFVVRMLPNLLFAKLKLMGKKPKSRLSKHENTNPN